MIIFILVGAVLLYIVGFFLGRKYEKDKMMDEVVGVLAEINKTTNQVETVTYYYSEKAYNDKIEHLKEVGEEYYE